MLDFAPVRNREIKFNDLVADLTIDDLRILTNKMIDKQLGLIAGCTDEDVVFEPVDLEAQDPYATDEAETKLPWTLGHIIVHVTASSEESSALAAEMARGVEFHGRSRNETPWREMKKVASCVHRLEESRRIRLASLEMWPDNPFLDNRYQPWPGTGRINAIGRFILGLSHDDEHLGQIVDVVQQAKKARGA